MKRIINTISLLLLVVLAACELEPQVQIAENPVPPAIVLPTEGTAYNFNWDNDSDTLMIIISPVDYGFPVGVSYTAEFVATGGDFERSRKLGFFTGDTLMVPVKKFNSEIKKLKVEDGQVVPLELRVSCFVSPTVEDLVSPVVNISFVPYSKPTVVDPVDPIDPTGPVYEVLYMIGAVTGGWDTAKAVEMGTTDEDNVLWTNAYFDTAAGTNFRFFKQADWGASFGGYDVFETYPTDLLEPASADSDPNFNFIGEAGWYKITVNINSKTITMEAISEPGLFLTGDATHGWDWDEPVSTITWVGHEIYEGSIDFIKGGAFRLFAQKDWSPTSYGWDFITNYDTNFIDIMEGHADPNWEFVAESGTYKVRVEMRAKSIEITQ
ncbi:MAG: SusF/SusE family outer membrane protein [Prolixibacteraceae bacterium]|nr:SusF/SusE family outer membrane protein [Prolixibacteraceae bacterium]